jgi:fluoroquinolone transport system permease protein
MNAINALKALGPIDARSVHRDSLLRWMIILPLLFALGVRWFFPLIFVRLGLLFEFDLMPYYPAIMSTLLLMLIPVLAGTVIGFLLLDQRDDQTLTALQVTPMSLATYLIYRFTVPLLLSMLITLIAFPLAGVARLSFPSLLLVIVAAAPQAPLFALFLAAFAQNKVQGFALTKASGILLWPPLIAYFVQSNWQFAFGLVPTYWPAKLLWTLAAGEANAWLYLVVGLVYQSLLMVVLMARFNRVMHQ